MRRFQGEKLPETPAIAVIANDAIGNYVVSTPLLQVLRRQYPDARLHYFSGTRAQELWSAEPLINRGYALFGTSPHDIVRVVDEPFDLVINIEQTSWARAFAAIISGSDTLVCGPCLGIDGRSELPFAHDERGMLWMDKEWIAPDLTSKYPFLESPFIGELFCRLAYLEGPVPAYRVPKEQPPFPTPELLIATAASLPEKLWTPEKWIDLLESAGMSAGLIGAKPSVQKQFWQGGSGEEEIVESGLVQDLRGQMTLPQVAAALATAKRVVTLDNGILHMAVAGGGKTVGLYRHGIHRLWAPPYENLAVLTPGENRPVFEIPVQQVLDAL